MRLLLSGHRTTHAPPSRWFNRNADENHPPVRTNNGTPARSGSLSHLCDSMRLRSSSETETWYCRQHAEQPWQSQFWRTVRDRTGRGINHLRGNLEAHSQYAGGPKWFHLCYFAASGASNERKNRLTSSSSAATPGPSTAR